MATKLNNIHLNKILLESNKYYILDVYFRLVNLSSEKKHKNSVCGYFIPTGYFTENIKKQTSILASIIKQYLDLKKCTVIGILEELQKLDILSFNNNEKAWELDGMKNMTKKNGKSKGFTRLNEFLLSREFFCCKPYQKRLFTFMASLKNSKRAGDFKQYSNADFSINLLVGTKWKNIIRSKNIYYAKNKINEFIDTFNKKKFKVEETEKTFSIIDKKYIRSGFARENKFVFAFNSEAFDVIMSPIREMKCHKKDMDFVRYLIDMKNAYEHSRGNKEIYVNDNDVLSIARVISNTNIYEIKKETVKKVLDKMVSHQIHGGGNISSIPAFAYSIYQSKILEYNKRLNEQNNSPDFERRLNAAKSIEDIL